MAKLKEEMQERRKNKQQYRILAVVSVCVALGAIWYLCFYYNSLQRQEKKYESLRQTEQIETEDVTETETEAEVVTETETELEEPVSCERVYDFVELRETNEDIYAWITVPGTLVDYPVLQSEEDNYYLERNLDHSTGYPGCIYTNKCNTKSFDDLHTVLYGHNMKNDSMFGSLHAYADKNFFDENRTILIYTEEKRCTYEIYGAVKFTDGYIPAVYGTDSDSGNEQFLQDLKANAEAYSSVSHLADREISPEDKLLTLSTCVYGETTKRYIVVGVLVEEQYYTE